MLLVVYEQEIVRPTPQISHLHIKSNLFFVATQANGKLLYC